MSHQTGIKANKDLKAFLATAKNGNVRLIKIGIENEELIKIDHKNVQGDWESDYDALMLPLLEEKQPCYIFYRLDSKNNLGYQWLFIPYSPDFAPIRQKMLFAGTKATLKTEFGGGLIVDELYGTTASDVSLAGYKKHMQSADADAPLTMAEIEMNEIKKSESIGAAATSKASTLPGISFPIDDKAVNELVKIKEKQTQLVLLTVDVDKETINLSKSCDSLEIESLPASVPTDKPSYVFYLFKHTHEGDYLESCVFIYCMPGYQCSVKERMLYSSCKGPLISGLESVLGLEIIKKIEISEPSELTAEFLMDECHPKKDIIRKKFDKPKGPGARGPRRITRPTTEES